MYNMLDLKGTLKFVDFFFYWWSWKHETVNIVTLSMIDRGLQIKKKRLKQQERRIDKDKNIIQ